MLLRNLALASSLVLAAAPAAAYAAPQTSSIVERASTKIASPSAEKSYAEREQQDTQVGEFSGGDVVIIGVSGGALIVLLFLLLILV